MKIAYFSKLLPNKRPNRFPPFQLLIPHAQFCIVTFESKIKAITRDQGDKIGFEHDTYLYRTSHCCRWQELSSACPPTHFALPTAKQPSLYCFCAGTWEISVSTNMSITLDAKVQPLVASPLRLGSCLLSCPIQRWFSYFDLVEDKNGTSLNHTRIRGRNPGGGRTGRVRYARVYFKLCPVSRHCLPQ